MISLLRLKPPGRSALARHALRPRGLQTTLPLHIPCEVSEEAKPERKVRKSQKKLSELPSVRLLPDGTTAAPLDTWYGGLGKPVFPSPKDSETSQIADTVVDTEDAVVPAENTLTTLEEDGTDTLATKSKSMRKQKKSTDEIVDVGEEPKKPRRRQPASKKKILATILGTGGEEERSMPSTSISTLIRANEKKYPHCIHLTRVGQFYESYFEQAVEVARLLNIKQARRFLSGRYTPMCGFPLGHLDRHLKTLVQHHKKFVALCEEFPKYSYGGTTFDRRVVRIITPGTLIDESFINPYENNYLLSITSGKSSSESPEPGTSDTVGLAWIDVSTGEFFTKSTTTEGLHDEVVRINPREVVLQTELFQLPSHPIRAAITEEGCFVVYSSSEEDASFDNTTDLEEELTSMDDITSHTDPMPVAEGSVLSDAETQAVALLTTYLRANLMEHMPRLASPTKESVSGRMQIDAHTLKALEIREGFKDGGTTGSLLSVVKRTVTTSGTRLLARWLCSPSTSLREINARQSLVAFFHARPFLREDIVQNLKHAEDATRIAQRFLLGRGGVSDLSAISNTIDIWTAISKRIELEKNMELKERGEIRAEEWASLDALMLRIGDLRDLSDRIRKAVVHQGSVVQNAVQDAEDAEDEQQTGEAETTPTLPSRDLRMNISANDWTIRPEYSEELTNLHNLLKNLLDERERLQLRLALEHDIPTLSLRSSPNLGMHVHIGGRKRGKSRLDESDAFIQLGESQSTVTYFNQEWAQLGRHIVDTTTEIWQREKEAFEALRNEVNARAIHLRRNARIMDELDVTIAFANLAQEMSFVRPVIREDTSYSVTNGRHPTVELGLLTNGRSFIPNTVSFSPTSQLHIITGPNMAGKSTLLRQTALIAVLAQTGSYVPADSAEIGIIDRVFSRVGARDDLFHDRSTFMVEMLETSDIMRRATPNSLVIMDEVGRGTTVEDGLAIAFAVVHHLQSVNHCRALFATHFHELADMLGITDEHRGTGAFENVSFFCTDVDETEDGYFTYSHRLRPGINRNSHGLKVAQLAGMPEPAVEVARTALSWLKQRSAIRTNDRSDLHAIGQSLTSH
ncbi:hypothetical protein OBBRIDRAFT_840969 [Obba rivulosa]|uniref:DNA mismatch repair proteins mutS family domain-containing protein n=1 Tax=Obba rivulosa TaxID=1052685 RepID=A0A8E2DVT6_9APHY|nr:hypothetical protein OBBRIDRAFT_840969 [Obba rivulosa]